jgi:hypothetical protein
MPEAQDETPAPAGEGTLPAEEGTPQAEKAVTPSGHDLDYVIKQTVFIRGANRPFGEVTRDDAEFRGAELKATVGWGPTAKVAPIARAWRELSMELQSAGVKTVAELPPETVVAFAPKLWVVPPRGSLL